jgi:hypothetical protein
MKKKHLVVLLCAVFALVFTACKTVPAATNGNSVIGSWKDSYGLTEYEFEPDGKMKIEALNIGSFEGNYHIEDDKITIEYSVVVQQVKDTYSFKLNGNTLYLDDKEYTRKT